MRRFVSILTLLAGGVGWAAETPDADFKQTLENGRLANEGYIRCHRFVEGGHGDGNFARTTIMYCLWKTQGVTIQPWRDDVILGAVRTGKQFREGIAIKLTAVEKNLATVRELKP
jgi:hypothetical protein